MPKASILIVEDQQVVALDLQTSLENCGYRVAGQADRGAAALQIAEALHPDLVLMDIGLKGDMDGIEAATQIRARLHLPVIFLTAYADEASVRHARRAEPYGYILKPFDERELASNIEMALYKHGADQKLRESEERFRGVIEHSSDGIVLADSQGKLIEWNPAVEQLTGLGRSRVLGQPARDVIFRLLPEEARTPAIQAALADPWSTVLENESAGGPGPTTEFEIRRKDQHRRILNFTYFRIDSPNGRLTGAVVVDVTSQKLAQQASRMQVERAEALARMASRLNAGTSLEQIFQVACEDLARALSVEIAYLATYDESRDAYQLVRIIAPDEARRSMPNGLFSQSMFRNMNPRAGQAMFIPDIRVLTKTHELTLRPDNNIRTLLASGLFHEGRKIGMLGILTRHKERRFSQDEITLLQTFAAEIAIAIDHARLLSATQRQAQRLMLVNEITQSTLAGSNVKETLDQVASRVLETLAATGCYITWWNNERQMPVPYAARGPESAAFMEANPASGAVRLSQTILRSGHAVFIEDDDQAVVAREGQGAGPANDAILALPLHIRDQNLGTVLIGYRKPHPYFLREDLERWEEVASQISLALAHILSIEQEKRRRREAELLQQATFAISSSLELQEVLDLILTALEQAVPFDSAAISLIEGEYLKMAALGGASWHTRQIGDKIGKSEGLFSLLAASRSPVVLGDAQMHPDYKHWSEDGQDRIHGWMGVPLIAHDHPIGYLMLNSWARDVYTADHTRLAQAFANQAAVAIENARLFEQVRNGRERLQALSRKLVTVQEAERRLLAHELHDEIGQELTGLQFVLSLGKEGSVAEPIDAFTEGQSLVSSLMSRVRELSLNLHPAMLDDLGLLPALQAYFERYQQQTGIRIRFEYDDLDARFPTEIELSAYRVVQEALTNAARYAEVKEVEVDLASIDASLCIRVEDHGKGFDLEILNDRDRCFGVTGMRERAYLAGGEFEIVSKPGQGVRLVAMFPIGTVLERRRNDRQSVVGR